MMDRAIAATWAVINDLLDPGARQFEDRSRLRQAAEPVLFVTTLRNFNPGE
jgi:hypothetical protein